MLVTSLRGSWPQVYALSFVAISEMLITCGVLYLGVFCNTLRSVNLWELIVK